MDIAELGITSRDIAAARGESTAAMRRALYRLGRSRHYVKTYCRDRVSAANALQRAVDEMTEQKQFVKKSENALYK